jgi:hypothetical protein
MASPKLNKGAVVAGTRVFFFLEVIFYVFVSCTLAMPVVTCRYEKRKYCQK